MPGSMLAGDEGGAGRTVGRVLAVLLIALGALALCAAGGRAQERPRPAGDDAGRSDVGGVVPTRVAPRGLELVLNIPAYRLDVLRGVQRVRSYRVAVGMPEHPTPTGRFAIRRITWNPTWVPPAEDWADDVERVGPGPDNPMGRVKLLFHEDYYLHGTPEPETIGSAGSHGCVRLRNEDALELARLVAREGGVDVTPGELTSLVRDATGSREVALERPVPFTALYRRVEVRGDVLEIHPDIYARGPADLRGAIVNALGETGVAAGALDARRIDRVVASAAAGREGVVRVRVDTLTRPGTAARERARETGPAAARPPPPAVSLMEAFAAPPATAIRAGTGCRTH